MALVHVNITINEELLSEQASRIEARIRQTVNEHYCNFSLLACQASEGGSTAAALAAVYFFVDDCIKYLYNIYKKKQEARIEERSIVHKHSILCECGWHKCLGYTPSIDTYVRKINLL